jgi:hypothetical protein
MFAARILAPHTKLATTRWWHTSTLAEECGVLETDETDLYAAMDWVLERQGAIEKKLAARHFSEGALALYDLSSSYFEGHCCPLAKIGYSRDGKRNTPQVNYGLLTTRAGCPVAISVYEGNTADVSTLMPQVTQLREQFGLERLVLVGDRGMISHKAIDTLRSLDGLAWITALKSSQIRALVQGGELQLGLFDERNLFEFSHPDFPNERLMACRNVDLGKLRTHKREALLEATEKELEKVRARIENGSLAGRDKIGARWALRHPHQRTEEADEFGRGGAQLQSARRSRAGVPLDENHRSAYPSDPPPSGGPRTGAHLPVHARLLCRMAHARGVARVDVCGRGPAS